MGRVTGRSVVLRVLHRIGEREQKAQTVPEQLNERAAWLMVHAAYFEKAADPYRAAVSTMQRKYPNYGTIAMPLTPTSPAEYPPQPELWELDGRNGRQWMLSIVGYLAWRAGATWRNTAQRNHHDYTIYTRAICTVSGVFLRPPPPPARRPSLVKRLLAIA